MGTYFQSLYAPVSALLAHCKAFAADATLQAIFTDPRLCEWHDDLLPTHNRERRIAQTVRMLYGRYNAAQENGLVILLQVLAEQAALDGEMQTALADMAERVMAATIKDSRKLFNDALAEMEVEAMLSLPYAGQVIAGTGDVALTYIDALRPGESYYLSVIGSSMEHEGIFAGDRIEMRVFNDYEWPAEGDMIVTKYLPYGAEAGIAPDLDEAELLGPTLKIFHQKANGEFLLGWRKDNVAWSSAPWRKFVAPGNDQMIVTHRIAPIGKVVAIKAQRKWNFAAWQYRKILGGQ